MSIRVVPGIHSATEAVKVRPESVLEIMVSEKSKTNLAAFLSLCDKKRLKYRVTSDRDMDKIVASHQGVILKVKGGPEFPDGNKLKEAGTSLILVLDHIVDPNNLGNMVRTAWQFGATGMVISKDRSAGLVPSAQKVASGGFEHIPIEEVANIPSFLKTLKDLGYWIYGLDAQGDSDLSQHSFHQKSVIVVGGEESGLKKATRDSCDGLLKISSHASAESFNASVAGALAAYEYRRQFPISNA